MQEAINRSIRELAGNPMLNVHAKVRRLEETVPGLKFNWFNGGSRLAEDFRNRHLHTVEGFLDAAYGNYPQWRRILANRLPKEADDPRVQFATATFHEELVGLGKSTPLTPKVLYPNPFYFGSHYVAEPFQKSSGLGVLVQDLALSGVRPPIYGMVAPHNPALERHFKKNGILGVAIDRDRDEKGQSEPLLRVVIAERCGFKTINGEKYPKEMVQGWANGVPLPDVLKDRVVVSRSSAESLVDDMREQFAEDRVLTRFFYEEPMAGPIMVFESRFLPGWGRVVWDQLEYENWRYENLPSCL